MTPIKTKQQNCLYQQVRKSKKNNIEKVEKIQYYLNGNKQIREGSSGNVMNIFIKIISHNLEVMWLEDYVLKQCRYQFGGFENTYRSSKHQLSVMSLVNHQNCLNLYDSFINNQNKLCLVMKKAKCSLDHKIKSQNLLLQLDILYYFKQIVYGLYHLQVQYLESQNITTKYKFIHRDLKPSNILIFQTNGEQVLKISDMIMSKIVDEAKNQLATIVGTPRYTSPQVLYQSKQNSYTQKCDVWSLGVILFRMLGYNIFENKIQTASALIKAHKNIKQEIKKGLKVVKSKRGNQLLKFWEQLITKTLEYEEEDRWSITQVKDYIQSQYKYTQDILYQKEYLLINPIIRITKQQYNIKIEKCWYDIHKFENQLIKNILFIKKQYKIISTKKIHINILLFLCVYEYHQSFQEGIKRRQFSQKYENQLHRQHYYILNLDERNHLIQSLLSVELNINNSSNKLILKLFPIFDDLNELIINGCFQQIIKQYLQSFQDQIAICPIAKWYIILFRIVSLKKKLVKLPNQLNPIIKNYRKIFKCVKQIVEFQIQPQNIKTKFKSFKKDSQQIMKQKKQYIKTLDKEFKKFQLTNI